jgi:hypothetical protein
MLLKSPIGDSLRTPGCSELCAQWDLERHWVGYGRGTQRQGEVLEASEKDRKSWTPLDRIKIRLGR